MKLPPVALLRSALSSLDDLATDAGRGMAANVIRACALESEGPDARICNRIADALARGVTDPGRVNIWRAMLSRTRAAAEMAERLRYGEPIAVEVMT